MNNYEFDEIQVGLSETFEVNITEEMMDSFKQITGDVNPLHNDEGYAKGKGYGDRVVYGMLTASFLSTLAGVYLPGERSLIHRVEADFLKPVLLGERITFAGEVTKKDERFQTLILKVSGTNADGEKVLRGKMRVGVSE